MTCNTISYPHAVPGYQVQVNGAFDWNADAVFLEAHSNSPPWWMTVSESSTGSTDGTSSNLNHAYAGNGTNSFASYLATVVGHFATDFGLTFRHVDPSAWGAARNQAVYTRPVPFPTSMTDTVH